MPRLSKYKTQRNKEKANKALMLYKEGWTLREVANVIGWSHEWTRQKIHEAEKEDTNS